MNQAYAIAKPATQTPLFLTDSDVTYEIFKQIACYDDSEQDEGSYKVAQKDLVSAALCCKAFMDGCLDLLWYRMYSIIPLIKLLPEIDEIGGKLVCSMPY